MYSQDSFLSKPLPPLLPLPLFPDFPFPFSIANSLLNLVPKHSLNSVAIVSVYVPHFINEQSTLYSSKSYFTLCLVNPHGQPFSLQFLSDEFPPYSVPCGGASHPWNKNLFDLVFPSVLTLHLVFLSPLTRPSKTA